MQEVNHRDRNCLRKPGECPHTPCYRHTFPSLLHRVR
nr:MAG TPA: hypothetical protein [Caudoviricetes sp.]